MQTSQTVVEQEIHLSFFEGIHDILPSSTGALPLPEFFKWIAAEGHVARETKEGQAFNLNCYDGNGRKEKNVLETSGIFIDLDDLDADEVQQIRNKANLLKSVCHTTFRHAPERPRLRLIVLLEEPISPAEYRKYAQRVAHHFDVKCDPCSFKVSQLYYTPSCPPGTEDRHFLDVNDTPPFVDLSTLPLATSKALAAKSTNSGSDDKQLNLFTLAETIMTSHFNGNIHSVGGEVFEYESGFWQATEPTVFAKRLSKMTGVDGVFTSAAQLEGLVRTLKVCAAIAEFPDATSMTANVLNGVLDLKTGSRSAHAPEHFHRNQLAVAYDPNSKCPRWLQHLDEVFRHDDDREPKIKFLQEWFGYMLTPSTAYQKMLWMIGSGANGKNIVLDAMANVLGEGNYTAMALNEIGNEFLRCGLHGKLANFSSEMEAGKRLNDGFIKAVVSGDSITANRKGLSPIMFRPYARLVSAMNDLPPLKDISHGFSRRLIVLQFNRTFAPEEMDHTLAAQIKAETAGILSWAIAGLLRLNNAGHFTSLPSGEAVCRQYLFESDPVAMFVAESLTPCAKNRIIKTAVYDAYKKFCENNGYPLLSNAQFGKALKDKGIASKDSNGKAYYHVELRTSDEGASKSTASSATSGVGALKPPITLDEFVGDDEDIATE